MEQCEENTVRNLTSVHFNLILSGVDMTKCDHVTGITYQSMHIYVILFIYTFIILQGNALFKQMSSISRGECTQIYI